MDIYLLHHLIEQNCSFAIRYDLSPNKAHASLYYTKYHLQLLVSTFITLVSCFNSFPFLQGIRKSQEMLFWILQFRNFVKMNNTRLITFLQFTKFKFFKIIISGLGPISLILDIGKV